jgi:hypothetical protein
MTDAQITLIAAVAPPIVAALVGAVSTRLGAAARSREAEDVLKRVELLERLRKLQQDGFAHHDWSVLDREVDEILDYVERTSPRPAVAPSVTPPVTPPATLPTPPSARSRVAQPWRMIELVALPRPASAWGWFATIVYYIYLAYTLGALAAAAASVLGFQTTFPLGDATSLLIGSVVLMLVARWGAMRAYRSAQRRAAEPRRAAAV